MKLDPYCENYPYVSPGPAPSCGNGAVSDDLLLNRPPTEGQKRELIVNNMAYRLMMRDGNDLEPFEAFRVAEDFHRIAADRMEEVNHEAELELSRLILEREDRDREALEVADPLNS